MHDRKGSIAQRAMVNVGRTQRKGNTLTILMQCILEAFVEAEKLQF